VSSPGTWASFKRIREMIGSRLPSRRKQGAAEARIPACSWAKGSTVTKTKRSSKLRERSCGLGPQEFGGTVRKTEGTFSAMISLHRSAAVSKACRTAGLTEGAKSNSMLNPPGGVGAESPPCGRAPRAGWPPARSRARSGVRWRARVSQTACADPSLPLVTDPGETEPPPSDTENTMTRRIGFPRRSVIRTRRGVGSTVPGGRVLLVPVHDLQVRRHLGDRDRHRPGRATCCGPHRGLPVPERTDHAGG
jgi:hypothetical protein